MSYWRLHYHLVWGTYRREALLRGEVESLICGAILGKANELGIIVHAMGIVEDHIHVVASIPPKISVADAVKHFKGASARYANRRVETAEHFGWQDGYGAITFGERAMAEVVAYVRNQRAHHAENKVRDAFERVAEEEDGVGARTFEPRIGREMQSW